MQYLTFSNGDRMPALGLGTWKSAPGEVGQAVREAIRTGYRHIDCAAIYGNEAEIGEVLDDCMKSGEISRDDLWITSKLWNNAHAKDQVPIALAKTLTDLRIDHLDLYLVHWPVAIKADVVFPKRGDQFLSLDDLPLAETWSGMESCVADGLARHIGVSNFHPGHIRQITRDAAIMPEMNQVEMHPYLQQQTLRNFCKEQGIHITAYAPLGSGDRPKSMKQAQEKSLLDNPVVQRIAQSRSCSPAQVLIQWALQQDVAVIPKSTNPARIAENLQAAEISLTEQDLADLAQLECGQRYVDGAFWTIEGSPYTLDALWGTP